MIPQGKVQRAIMNLLSDGKVHRTKDIVYMTKKGRPSVQMALSVLLKADLIQREDFGFWKIVGEWKKEEGEEDDLFNKEEILSDLTKMIPKIRSLHTPPGRKISDLLAVSLELAAQHLERARVFAENYKERK